LESYTARLARPSSAPKHSSAHQTSAHKPAYATNITHPTQQSPITPFRPRTTQYTFRGNDEKFNTTRRYATTPTGSASRPTPRPAQHCPTTPARSGTPQYFFKDNGERFRTTWHHGTTPAGSAHHSTPASSVPRCTPRPAQQSPTTPTQTSNSKYSFKGSGEKFSTTWGHAATPVGARHKSRSRPRPPDQRNKPSSKRTHPIYIIDSDDDIICKIDKAELRIKCGRY
jgi:hypothetical protein